MVLNPLSEDVLTSLLPPRAAKKRVDYAEGSSDTDAANGSGDADYTADSGQPIFSLSHII